ncbi:MAG: hypothetical protein ACTHL8_21730 [Burkholderiaceae bacterium]
MLFSRFRARPSSERRARRVGLGAVAVACVALLSMSPAPARAAVRSAATGASPLGDNALAADWVLGDYGDQPGQRLALVVRAQVAGRPCQLQIDTGLDEAVRWHGETSGRHRMVPIEVEFAGQTVNAPASPDVARQLANCPAGVTVGALGNAFFESGSLALDLKSARVRFTPGATLATRLDAQPLFYARAAGPGGHPLVEVRKDGALRGYALLDTGSPALGFEPLARDQWDAVTGGLPLKASPEVHAFAVQSGGRTHACLAPAAASAASFQAGTWALAALPVSWCPTLAPALPLRLEGVLGLRGFADSIVTIDYVSGRWLVEKADKAEKAR